VTWAKPGSPADAGAIDQGAPKISKPSNQRGQGRALGPVSHYLACHRTGAMMKSMPTEGAGHVRTPVKSTCWGLSRSGLFEGSSWAVRSPFRATSARAPAPAATTVDRPSWRGLLQSDDPIENRSPPHQGCLDMAPASRIARLPQGACRRSTGVCRDSRQSVAPERQSQHPRKSPVAAVEAQCPGLVNDRARGCASALHDWL
jgi:hypothetical protein